MKAFPGQAKNEKVLYSQREKFLIWFLSKIIVFILASLFLIVLNYLVSWYFLLFEIIFLWLVYEGYLWENSYLVITNKRILKFAKSGLFNKFLKEFKLLQLTEITGTSNGILNKILTTGNVKFVGKDKEAVIWFRNVLYPKELALYVSRLKYFIKKILVIIGKIGKSLFLEIKDIYPIKNKNEKTSFIDFGNSVNCKFIIWVIMVFFG